MNKQIILIVLSLTVLSLGCVSPMVSVEGRYISEVNPDTYLELCEDGLYVVNQNNAFGGQYTVNDNTVTLIHTFGSFELVRDGNILIDGDGERWIKESCI
ncbi:MAG: hypothetical protein KAJ93_02575 [Methanosarcinales archaeon]|nr:hypothetical protein [Methanosarcinales archaeon]